MFATLKTIPIATALIAVLASSAGHSPRLAKPFQREQIKGNVRVVLLRVDRATVFSNDGLRQNKPGEFHAVPHIGVTYVVEALGDEPIKNWNSVDTGEEFSVDGKRAVDQASLPENVIPGGHGATHPMTHYSASMGNLPVVQNQKRCAVVEHLERGTTRRGPLDLQIKAGFNGETHTFEFSGIPLE